MSLLLQDTLVISPATVNRIEQEIEDLRGATDCADVVQDKAALDAYDTSKLTDNAIVKVLQDESRNDAETYYRYSKSSDSFTFIGELGPYYTKAESDNIETQIRQDFAAADTTLQNNIDAEETRATGVEVDLSNMIDTVMGNLDTHTADTSNPHSVTKAQVGLGNVDNTSDLNKPISTATQTALNLKLDKTEASSTYATITNLNAHTSNTSNPHGVTKAQVGLGNVDNTSDANKPISTATQTALDGKVDKSNSASQVYGTDSTGAQTTYNIDSFGQVDDVRVNGTSIVSNKIANIDLTTKSGITLRVWGGNE